MSIIQKFKHYFSEDNLKRIFTEHVIYSGATGIDNLDQYAFRRQLNEQVAILSRKVQAGTYKFSKYKLKLVSKGRGKNPREIAIPTVRDRIAMRALCDFLGDIFEDSIRFQLPQNIVKQVKKDVGSGFYDGCIKLDVSDFYPSVKHDELFSRLRKRIKIKDIIDIVSSAVSSPTVAFSKASDQPSTLGVPQGLAVSNILAAIYLINVDRYARSISSISYYRYVDDVLILCRLDEAESIAAGVISRFQRIGLKIHDPMKSPEKSSIGSLKKRFDYLGYQFDDGKVSARASTADKLRGSLAAIFTSYKHSKLKSKEFLLWRLNLRVTGCVFENKSKGWLFFFSEINDETLLHELDHYIAKLLTRFDVDIEPKKFSRAFKELSHRRYETKYIPNFDKYNLDEKRQLLAYYFNVSAADLSDEEVEYEFHKRIGRQVKDLLEDVGSFS